jgi:ABC-type polysaccharide/polyol phosphate transport system ATPase subunit
MSSDLHDDVVLRCEGLRKEYRRGVERHNLRHALPGSWGEPRGGEAFDALVDVSFEVRAGEAVGIVGPNGAGKSTLLKAVSGLVTPTAGSVAHRGRVASIVELGVGFHPDLTGVENVRLTAALHGLSAEGLAERLEAIAAFADIGDALDTPVKWYSTGMLARLGFAVAVHLDADLIVVDEVLSVGDQEFRERCQQRLWQMREAGATLLLVSHDLVMVDHLCDRALHLEQGRVVDDGPVHQVLDRYGGAGASTGQTWAGGPADIRSVALEPPVIAAGDAFVFIAELEVVRPLPALLLDFHVFPRLPGINVDDTQAVTALQERLVLDEEHRRPGRFRVVGEMPAFPASGGMYDCILTLVERDDGAPLAVARALLEVAGPRYEHAMVVLDSSFRMEHVGPVP